MTKYEVELSRTQVHLCKIEVEAEDEDAAEALATQFAEADLKGEVAQDSPIVEWLPEEDSITTEEINEL